MYQHETALRSVQLREEFDYHSNQVDIIMVLKVKSCEPSDPLLADLIRFP